MLDLFFILLAEWLLSRLNRMAGKGEKKSFLAADPVTRHLAHDASVMHLRDAAGGSFKALLAVAPAVQRFSAAATVSYSLSQ